MLIDLCTVAPGDLPDEIFAELVAGKDYGPDMVEALRSHLVHGLDIKSSVKAHGVYANKFKIRLEKLKEEIIQAGKINAVVMSAMRKEFEAKMKEFDANLDCARVLALQLSAALGPPSSAGAPTVPTEKLKGQIQPVSSKHGG